MTLRTSPAANPRDGVVPAAAVDGNAGKIWKRRDPAAIRLEGEHDAIKTPGRRNLCGARAEDGRDGACRGEGPRANVARRSSFASLRLFDRGLHLQVLGHDHGRSQRTGVRRDHDLRTQLRVDQSSRCRNSAARSSGEPSNSGGRASKNIRETSVSVLCTTR